ncbi:MAG: aminotransferase class IV family protein [Moraxella sp.]|nr:aminotransferase class IV family protein [Moraxella sp.]
MSQSTSSLITLIETMALVDGEVQQLAYHQRRYQQGLFFLEKLNNIAINQRIIELSAVIGKHAPPQTKDTGVVRCRVEYDGSEAVVTYAAYHPKPIQRFKLVYDDAIDYTYKYANRESLNALLAQKDECDEVIIIKNGFVSDCSIGNLLFFKDGRWYTPDTPLLQGVTRQRLLETGQITAISMPVGELTGYQKVMMINALNPFDISRALDIACVVR